MSKELKVMFAIGAIFIIGAVAFYLKTANDSSTSGQPIDSQRLLRSESHGTGVVPNKVTLIEFGDFQCPACAAAHPIIKKILDHYKGETNFTFVFRNFPLTSIHPNAQKSSEAAEAAAAQGKYWEMNNKLYESQNEWSGSDNAVEIFVSYAEQLGLNKDQFKSELQNGKYFQRVNEDFSDGEKVGVDSTPTFFLNGEKLVGVPNYEDLIQKIDAALSK